MTPDDKLLRGMGRVYKRRRRDPETGEWVESAIWWVQYYHQGEKVRKSSGSRKHSEAIKYLKHQHELASAGRVMGGVGGKLRFPDLVRMIDRDYTYNNRRSLSRAERAMKHLTSFFSGARAADITRAEIDRYVDYRMGDTEKAAAGTVKYEISILKRMFHLAKDSLGNIPSFPVIHVSNIRKGFFERHEFDKFIVHFDVDLQAAIRFAYLTGWRIKSEILSMTWPQVDFHACEVRLEPGTTKTGEGRTLPFTDFPEVKELLLEQKALTDELRRSGTPFIKWVFHRKGKQIADIRKSWQKALDASGIGKRIPHDFRRTAVRNYERSKVPRSVAMRLVGHKTESMYQRYAITSTADLRDGMKSRAAYETALDEESAKVIDINQKQKEKSNG